MEFTLSHNHLTVKVNSKGAELSSILFNGNEYLWQANPDVWPRHAPVLFPIVGKLVNNTFRYNGHSYSLPQHGFARDMEFECLNHSNTQVRLVLRSTDQTKVNYPFDFELLLSYTIKDNAIECGYLVKNASTHSDMYFSIGAHPGFKIPLQGSETWNDYQIVFEKDKRYYITKLSDGLLSDIKIPLELNNARLDVTNNLFDNDALVFENAQLNQVAIISSKTNKGVEVQCNNWPYFGIWSKKGSNNFICLEPWQGIADFTKHNGELKSKKGIIQLGPKEEFNCSYSICFF